MKLSIAKAKMWGTEKNGPTEASPSSHANLRQPFRLNTMADLGLSERSQCEVWSYSCSQRATWVPFVDSQVSAGCWSPTTALSWRPCSLQPLALVQWGHICTAHWSMPAPFCTLGTQQNGVLCIHTPELSSFPLSPSLPQISFPLPDFWEQGLANATIKHFLGEHCLLWVKTMAGAMPAMAQWAWHKLGPAYRCSLATFACGEAEPDGSPSGWAKGKSALFKLGTQDFRQIGSLFFHSMWS